MQGTENRAETCHKLKKSAHVMGLSGHHDWIQRLLFVLGAFSLPCSSLTAGVLWVFFFGLLFYCVGFVSGKLFQVASKGGQPTAPANSLPSRNTETQILGEGRTWEWGGG